MRLLSSGPTIRTLQDSFVEPYHISQVYKNPQTQIINRSQQITTRDTSNTSRIHLPTPLSYIHFITPSPLNLALNRSNYAMLSALALIKTLCVHFHLPFPLPFYGHIVPFIQRSKEEREKRASKRPLHACNRLS